jgi:hypothetical protein
LATIDQSICGDCAYAKKENSKAMKVMRRVSWGIGYVFESGCFCGGYLIDAESNQLTAGFKIQGFE